MSRQKYLRTNYAKAEMWKAEKSRLKYVQPKSAKLISGLAITILGYFKLLQSTSYTWMKNIGMKNRSGVKNSRDEEIGNEKSFKCLDDMYTYLFFLATLTRYFITVKLRTNIRYHYIIILIYTMFDTLNTFLNLFIKHLLLG